MARMQAMEAHTASGAVKVEATESVGPLVSQSRGGGATTQRKVSFRVRGAGRRRRDSRARQSTVAALTSKFNALTVQTATGKEGAPRVPPTPRVRPRCHQAPATGARSHAGVHQGVKNATGATHQTASSSGGVKATIQIFEQQQQRVSSKTSPVPATKPPSLVLSSKAKSVLAKKQEVSLADKKLVPIPPKPQLKPLHSTFTLPLIKSHQQPKSEVISKSCVKIMVKPTVPVKNQHIIREYLEATEKNNFADKLKSNKSSLFLNLNTSSSAVQNKQTDDKFKVNKSALFLPLTTVQNEDSDEETPTQETSLVAEVLSALAEQRILSTEECKAAVLPHSELLSQCKAVLPQCPPPPIPELTRQSREPLPPIPGQHTPDTPRPAPNTSFLWSTAVNHRQSEEPEDYDDVYVSARNSYTALRVTSDEGHYEYCGRASSLSYDDCVGEKIYDDVKSLAAASNCYESIGSCAPSYCEKNNSLYGLPEEHRVSGAASSSGCSLGSSSPRLPSRASTVSVEEDDGPMHEVLSYQLVQPGHEPSEPVYTERRSEAGSDDWVDIELSESEEQLGPCVDVSESLLVPRERSRPRRSPSWSHMVRRHQMSSRRLATMHSEVSSSSDSDHHYETLYETVGGHGTPGDAATLKPALVAAPPPPLDEDEAFDSDVTDSSFDSDSSEEPPILRNAIDLPPRQLPDLPPPPVGTNKKITKIAEAAGRKMRKIRNNFTLRKRDISDKLRRLSTTSPATTPTSENPPKPPASAPPLLEKSVSTGNLTGRKSWSFKDKFARQVSTPSIKRESVGSSIFYVSPSSELPPPLPQTPAPNLGGIGDRNSLNRRSKTESVCSSGRGSSAGSEVETAPRRLSRVAVRPKTPPPPPPTEGTLRTCWYADIEISSLQPQRNDSSSESVGKTGLSSMEADISWYSEIGLDSSTGEAESSHTTASSGASSSGSPDGSVVHGCFADEPLYQFYAASVLEEAKRELSQESDSDGYEEIGERGREGGAKLIMTSRPTAMELVKPREGHRTLWCEVPDVIDSRILDSMNQQQRKLQEAKFEVVTSEASYAKSLAILATHFVQCPEFLDESVLSKTDKHILFSNILPVKACSDRFLTELERCWQEDILLPDICEVVLRHATKHFKVYVKYCSHQIYLDRTLRKLKESNPAFSEALTKLESAPECHSLSLHSFLNLPMQRVTRLPLLLDAVIRRLSARDAEYETCKSALFALNKVVQECNEGARCMERMEEMLLLSRQLEFREDVRAVPLISSTRWLVRSGELTQLTWKDEAKLTFGRRLGKLPVCVFLFTDLLVVAKRKGDETFQVLDYCARNLVQVSCPEEDGLKQLPVRGGEAMQGRNLLLLTLLENHEGKTVEMVLSCNLESDRQRWLTAFTPTTLPENPEERVYEEWDCPQVQAVHAYTARQPDELSLEVADVVNVMRKLPDGWFQGERIRDGIRGWFPGNYCREVLSSHVRARNLRQRYRLLALSREYLEQQRAAQLQNKQQSKPKSKVVKPKMQPPPVPTPLSTPS